MKDRVAKNYKSIAVIILQRHAAILVFSPIWLVAQSGN
jgi:hypothetical protein